MATRFTKPVRRKIVADMGPPYSGVAEFVVTMYVNEISIRRKSSRTEYAVPLSYIFWKGAELKAIEAKKEQKKRRTVRRGLIGGTR